MSLVVTLVLLHPFWHPASPLPTHPCRALCRGSPHNTTLRATAPRRFACPLQETAWHEPLHLAQRINSPAAQPHGARTPHARSEWPPSAPNIGPGPSQGWRNLCPHLSSIYRLLPRVPGRCQRRNPPSEGFSRLLLPGSASVQPSTRHGARLSTATPQLRLQNHRQQPHCPEGLERTQPHPEAHVHFT